MPRFTRRSKRPSKAVVPFKRTYRRATSRRLPRASYTKYKKVQQADSKLMGYKVTCIGDVKINNTVGTSTVNNFAGTSVFPTLPHLLKSEEFLQDSRKYDQFKINFVNVKITPYSMISSLDDKSQQLLVTAWDRNGVEDEYSVPNYSELLTYSSKKESVFCFGNKLNSIWRTIKPDGLLERSTFYNTKDYKLIDIKDVLDDTKFMFHTDPATQKEFNPLLLIGLQCASSLYTPAGLPIQPVINSPKTFSFQMEWSFGVTFKGKRCDNGSFGPGIINSYQWRNQVALPQSFTVDSDIKNKVNTNVNDLPSMTAYQTDLGANNINNPTVNVKSGSIFNLYGFKYRKYNSVNNSFDEQYYKSNVQNICFASVHKANETLTMDAEHSVLLGLQQEGGYVRIGCFLFAPLSNTTLNTVTFDYDTFCILVNFPNPQPQDQLIVCLTEQPTYAATEVDYNKYVTEVGFSFGTSGGFERRVGTAPGTASSILQCIKHLNNPSFIKGFCI